MLMPMIAVPTQIPPAQIPPASAFSRSAIHNGSAERMKEIADGSVDLVVTSPPYFNAPDDPRMQPALARSGGDPVRTYPDLLDFLERVFAEMLRVLKPGGIACVNVASTIVGRRTYPLPFDLAVRLLGPPHQREGGIDGDRWLLRDEIIWRRWRGGDRRAGTLISKPYPGYYYPNRLHQHVLILTKHGPPIWQGRSQGERAASVVKDALCRDGFYVHELASSIWSILPLPIVRGKSEEAAHPCAFPEELAYRLISLYSYRNETVLDPFAGSGTTAKVARHLGRRFVGYEVNPNFASMARRRAEDLSPVRRERYIARYEPVLSVPDGAVVPEE